MTTIIAWQNGLQTRRCDGKCHEAKSPASECKCICGGRFHGIGGKRAVDECEAEIAAVMVDIQARLEVPSAAQTVLPGFLNVRELAIVSLGAAPLPQPA